jgi:HK97 family phage prohead protease
MENKNILETRYATEIRANTETGVISGTAIVFNQESNLLGGQFKEVIRPEAATEEFLRGQDIVMKYNHGQDSILARYRPNAERNSLHFNVDERGVHFDFKAKAKDAGLLESIAAGDLNAASFAFRVSPDANAERWEKRSDGTYLRTINKFDVVKDFSIVIEPAYSQTVVSTRGIEEIAQQEEAERLKKEQERRDAEKVEADKKAAEAQKLTEYYKKYEEIINGFKK